MVGYDGVKLVCLYTLLEGLLKSYTSFSCTCSDIHIEPFAHEP